MQLLEQGTQEKMQRVGAAYMDLNGLKEINDRKGHEAGDAFIKKATGVITEVFGDSAYRLGGDEFAVVMKCKRKCSFRILAFLSELFGKQNARISKKW